MPTPSDLAGNMSALARHERQGLRRRDVLSLAAGAFAFPRLAYAQPKTMSVIGFLRAGEPPVKFVEAFEHGLQDLGFLTGRNVRIEFRIGSTEQLARFAHELVRLEVDAILASASSAALAAKRATSSIPIVMAAVFDPVEVGLVTSLARPGGNITGTAVTAGDMAGKRLQLLRELVPGLKRVGMLSHPGHASNALQVKATETSAKSLGLALNVAQVLSEDDFLPALRSLRGVEGLTHADTPLFHGNLHRLVQALAVERLPAIHPIRAYPDAGGLISYGADVPDIFRRSGRYVGRILKGEKPADLPVEQPAAFELVINARTARALGLSLPPSIALRAVDVIE